MIKKIKKTSLKWKVITLLAWSFDEFTDWIDVLSSPYIRIGELGYKKQTILGSLRELNTIGYIEKNIKKGQIYIRLTDENKRNLIADIPLIKMREKPWDKLWREVIFDIPERQEKKGKVRTKIREKLIELGFGMLQKSVWISPFDFVSELEEYFSTLGFSEYVKILEARYIGGVSEQELAREIWPVDLINNRYREFIKEWSQENLAGSREKGERIDEEFLDILINDPALPTELLPRDWLGSQAMSLYQRIKDL